MQAAPFYDAVADGPDGGAAHWLTTTDGLRIRVGHWPHADAKGTVLLFPGRTEYIEKYGRAAGDLARRGYATVAIDWRGQGLADRMLPVRGLGHVHAFPDYQHDVAATLAHVRALGLPEPYYLIAHSMGGCIGLRALYENLPVKAAMFSAPMWGIIMSPTLRPVAYTLSAISRRLGFDSRISPGRSTDSYLDQAVLADNELTNDADMFAYMQHQIRQHPDLGLGGPTLRWLHESLWEMRHLSAKPAPNTPCITFLGTDEAIVDPLRIRRRMGTWPNGDLVVIPTGRHEMMMESPAIKDPLFDRTCALFDANP